MIGYQSTKPLETAADIFSKMMSFVGHMMSLSIFRVK